MRIIFMGTPDFAVPSLDILVKNGFKVVAVITATDKMGGRGKKQVLQSAIKKYAVEQGIKVLQPKNLKAPEFVEELKALKADLQIVVAFRMLPEVVWNMPPMGTVNLHGSLLPRYRGAAPINWAVINGDTETGVTTFKLKHEIDTGDMIFQERMPIGENETVGEVHDRMMELGANTILKTVQALESDDYQLLPQDATQVSKAPKLHRETCEIDFNLSTKKVHDFIRGLSPYPTAWTTLEGLKLKIYKTTKELIEHDDTPGRFISDNKHYCKIATIDGYLNVEELQLQGKKRMKIKDFLNGYDFN